MRAGTPSGGGPPLPMRADVPAPTSARPRWLTTTSAHAVWTGVAPSPHATQRASDATASRIRRGVFGLTVINCFLRRVGIPRRAAGLSDRTAGYAQQL